MSFKFFRNTYDILQSDIAENSELNFHRLLSVVSFIFVPIYGWVLNYMGINYPMPVVWTLSGIFFIFFTATFVSKQVQKNPTPYLYILYILSTLWVIHLNHFSNYSVDTVIAVIVISFCISLLLKKNTHLMWYIIMVMATVVASSIVIDDPIVNRATMSMGIVLFGLVAYFILSSKNENEENLRRREQELSISFNQMPALLWTTDEKLRFLSATGASLELLGLKSHQIVGRTMHDFFQMRNRELTPIAQHLKALKGEPSDYEFDWDKLFFHCHVEPLRDNNGKIIGCIGIGQDITERKKAQEVLQKQEAVRKSEIFFKSAMENMPFIALRVNDNGDINFANKYFADLTQYSKEEIIGANWFEKFVPQHERARRQNLLKEFFALPPGTFTEKFPYHQNSIVNKSGELLTINWGFSFSYDENGNKISLNSIGENITEKKKAEEALKLSDNILKRVANLVVVADKEGLIKYVSPYVKTILGYNTEELLGNGWWNLTHQDIAHSEQEKQHFSQIARGERTNDEKPYDNLVITKNGEEKWLLWQDSVTADGMVIGVAYDITERKKAETLLKQTSDKLQNYFDNAYDLIQSVDENWKYIYVNKAWEKMLGYSEQEAVKMTMKQVIHPDYLDHCMQVFGRLMKGEAVPEFEIAFVCKNGISVELIGSVIPYMKKGKFVSTMGFFKDITQRKEAEKLLLQSEQKYRTLIETMNEGVLYVDNKDAIQFANKQYCEMTGYSLNELIGKVAYKLMMDEEGQKFILQQNHERQVGVSNDYEIQIRKKNREKIWVHISGVPVRDESGKIIGSMGTHLDISPRKKAELELKQSEEKWRSLVQNAPDIILHMSLEGKILFINTPTASTVIGKSAYEFMPKGQHIIFNNAIDTVIRTGKPTNYELQGIKSTGELGWYYTRLSPIFHDDKLDSLALITTEVTERKKIESQIKASEEKFRGIFESIQDIYCRTDKDSFIQIVSPSVKNVLGFEPEELIGKNIAEIYVNPQDMERLIADLRAFGKSTNFEAAFKTKDGKEIIISTNANYIFDAEGKMIGTEGVGRNITKQKMAEREMARARKLAEESSKTKSEFVANMSHEIRTPMNGIMGMLDLLMNSHLNKEQKEYALTIKDSTNILLHLINDILDFSALETHKVKIKAEPANLILLLEKVISSFEREAKSKNIFLGYELIASVPKLVLIDEFRITQLMMNLMSNALKFTNEGSIIIRISQIGTKQKARLKFEVMDTGIGIAKEDQNKLFRKFSQIDSSLNKKYKGTGLGLAICDQLVKLMGGEIDFSSELGQGSNFWFTLKFGLQKENELLENMKIALITDEEKGLKNISISLDKWKIHYDKFSPKQLITKQKYQIAIVDIKNGAAKKISDKLNHLPKIFVTERTKISSLNSYQKISSLLPPASLMNLLMTSITKQEQKSIDEKISSLENIRFEKSKILLIEDDIINQKVMERMLNKLGIEVEIASNGTDGFELASKKNYDLILTDYHLPGKSGLNILEELKSLKEKKLPPIIILTANALEEHKEKFISTGAAHYLVKPINFSSLIDTLSKWFNFSEKFQMKKSVIENKKEKSQQSSEFLNHQLILHLQEIFRDEFENLMNDYQANSQKLIASIQDSLDTNDLKSAEIKLHTLRGTSATLGIVKIAQIAEQTEQLLLDKKIDSAKKTFEDLKKNFNFLKKLMPQYFKDTLIHN